MSYCGIPIPLPIPITQCDVPYTVISVRDTADAGPLVRPAPLLRPSKAIKPNTMSAIASRPTGLATPAPLSSQSSAGPSVRRAHQPR